MFKVEHQPSKKSACSRRLGIDLRPRKWWQVLPKRRFTYWLHGTISQKIAIYMSIACETLILVVLLILIICISKKLSVYYLYKKLTCDGDEYMDTMLEYCIPFKYIPAIATENLLVLFLFSLFTTCFGPYGPSSGEIQLHYLHILRKLSILQRISCFIICLLLST
jgi:hypothetical protein